MTSSITTILVLGATSGIGHAFTKRLHSMGKRVIAVGRRTSALSSMSASLPGLETYALDISDFSTLGQHAKTLMEKYPDINTVWVNAGTTNRDDFTTPEGTSEEKIREQIDTNVTGVTLLAHYFVPWLVGKGERGSFWVTGSGTGFVPVPFFPVYAPSKSYVHLFCVALRMQLRKTKVSVVEIVPPLVRTGLGAESVKEGKIISISLEEFEKGIFEVLDGNEVEDLREVTVPTAQARVDSWREGPGKLVDAMGFKA